MAHRADTSPRRRRRRTAEEARRAILAAAERRLVAEGPGGLRVQAIARDVGVTDAAVHHHFGSRRGLAEALLRHAGRRLRDEVIRVAARWGADELAIEPLAAHIGRVYGDLGYARLTLWLRLFDRPARGAGMFRDLAAVLHAARARRARARRTTPPPLDDSLLAVAALNLVLWAEPLVAPPLLRSVGLPSDRATIARLRRWFVRAIEEEIKRPRARRAGSARRLSPRRRPGSQ